MFWQFEGETKKACHYQMVAVSLNKPTHEFFIASITVHYLRPQFYWFQLSSHDLSVTAYTQTLKIDQNHFEHLLNHGHVRSVTYLKNILSSLQSSVY